jgi:hypothetical protein
MILLISTDWLGRPGADQLPEVGDGFRGARRADPDDSREDEIATSDQAREASTTHAPHADSRLDDPERKGKEGAVVPASKLP